jgi:peptide-methionine (R)-S-oxide reductase
MQLSDDNWKKKLTKEQYIVLRQKGQEAPFSGDYLVPDKSGVYKCVGCGAELFSTSSQYESTLPGLMGWPSFADVIKSGAVKLLDDTSYGMQRTEVICANCGGHLGHLFDDPTSPNGKHYCINSVCLDFKEQGK